MELNPKRKFAYARLAIANDELKEGLSEFRLKSVIFYLWVSDINLMGHRKPNIVNRVAIMITQAMSPILRRAWIEYSYQYSQNMNTFVDAMYEVIDSNVSPDSKKTPQYVELALKVLQKVQHIDVTWDSVPLYYTFRNIEYVADKDRHSHVLTTEHNFKKNVPYQRSQHFARNKPRFMW